MRKIFWSAAFFLVFFLPGISFSSVRIGIRIPIFTGPQGPPVYVQSANVPSGMWEDVSLDGVIVRATAGRILVRTPEGIDHSVYFTDHTAIAGRLDYGAPVTVEARLVNGALYATTIRVVAGQALLTPPPANANAYPNVPPPPIDNNPYPTYVVPYPYPVYVYPYPSYVWPEISVFGRFGWGWGHHRR